ncbi:MAG: M3 family oligoendopeptidase [Nitrospiraceae bacterium]
MKRFQTSPAQRSNRPTDRTTRYPDRWDLSDLIHDPVARLDHYFKELDGLVSRFEGYRARLTSSMPEELFLDILRLDEEIARHSTKLGAHAYLWFSENTKDLTARSFKSQVEEQLTTLQNRLLFFELWWQSVDKSNADRLMSNAGDFRYYLETIRHLRPHTLSEPEEKIINIKNNTGRTAIHTLYDVVTNALTFTVSVQGKRKTVTREGLMPYLRSPTGSVREAAYRELFRVYASHHDLLGELYKALVNDWKAENIQLRHFASPIASRNLANDVPDQAVQALLSICVKNREVFQHYFRLKARLCRIAPMTRYHIYAPHQTERKTYRYADAVRMVLDAYRSFSPRLADLAERVFIDQHIDARVRPGKMGGAYCYGVVPGLTPYVLLNFTGEARDIATMAHELGHAVHGMLAEEHTVFTFHATLPLAETASVFGERILSDTLMQQEKDKRVKQGLLLAQLDDVYATVMRQAYFVLFEQHAHDMIANGGTVPDLAHAYLANIRDQFGKTVRVPREFEWEWLTIPHIFASPFYCYSYSFGNLLVLALYGMYQKEGADFVPRYENLLARGGSRAPQDILQIMGVDMTSETFWQSGFDTIRAMVDQLEQTC